MTVVAAVHGRADSRLDPKELGEEILSEWRLGHISAPVLSSAAEVADGGLVIANAELQVPTLEEVRLKLRLLSAWEQELRLNMADPSNSTRVQSRLVGKLNILLELQKCTEWKSLRVPGDGSSCDDAWNKGFGDEASKPGRYCAFCASRQPKLLARHRMVDCARRLLCCEPDYTEQAMGQVESNLQHSEIQHSVALDALKTLILQRGKAQEELKCSQHMIKFLRRYEAHKGTSCWHRAYSSSGQ